MHLRWAATEPSCRRAGRPRRFSGAPGDAVTRPHHHARWPVDVGLTRRNEADANPPAGTSAAPGYQGRVPGSAGTGDLGRDQRAVRNRQGQRIVDELLTTVRVYVRVDRSRSPADLGGPWRLLESTVALQIGPFWAQRPAAYGVRFSFPGPAHSP